MTSDLNQNLKTQCAEQRERCQYTSASLFIWLRTLRLIRIVFIVGPIVFGGIAGWDILKGPDGHPLFAATMTLLASIVPAVYSGLKLDDHLQDAARLAGEYKNLEILFGVLENVGSLKSFADFEPEFTKTLERLQLANSAAYTAPEWCFVRARNKVQRGHYSFDK
ncbi:hypothetical protein [Bradyrhizobium sp. UNPF46]|uniref:hypothetical protein n=1 Tax=Bradyrhizobium sp. UNPF46 TaxID=1141168 RepID=UPI0015F09CA6|nr:hypothetical protein [Bradyrhizobium sp. UNPF46]